MASELELVFNLSPYSSLVDPSVGISAAAFRLFLFFLFLWLLDGLLDYEGVVDSLPMSVDVVWICYIVFIDVVDSDFYFG